MDYVCSMIRPDHANHQIQVPVESTIPNHSFVNFVMVDTRRHSVFFTYPLALRALLVATRLHVYKLTLNRLE